MSPPSRPPNDPAMLDIAFVTELERDIPPETLHVLTQVAVLAVRRHLIEEAELVSAGLGAFEPYYSAVTMTQATVAAATGRRSEALAMLERLVAEEPHFHAAVCACAALRKELGHPDWRSLAQRVARDGNADPFAQDMARSMLDLSSSARPDARLLGASAQQAGLRFAS